MCDLYVFRTDSQARGNPNRRKGWSVRSQTINREVNHFLFTDWALAVATVNTLGEYSSYDETGILDRKTSHAPDFRQNLCQNARKADDNA